MRKKNKGLYIHIPFCDEICPYCAFSHFLSSNEKKHDYVTCLIEDINNLKDEYFTSIYIGGGTPTSLKIEELERLFIALKRYINDDVSFTIEANPSSLDEDKIRLFAKYHVNRVSLGVQTFQKELQEKIHRFSDYEHIKALIELLNKHSIFDINLDLMYGIENETLDQLKLDLDLLTLLNITHISTYCLQVEEHTMFFNNHVKEMNQDDAADEYSFICNYLKNKNFMHYEISNFAKENYQSKHNLLYWHNEEYVGLGISSAGFEDGIRYVNENSLSRYLNRKSIVTKEYLTKEDYEKYYIILNLRLNTGINLDDYKNKYNIDFKEKYKSQIEKLQKYKYIEIDDSFIRVKEEFFFIINTILVEFF